jgi:hypothetical protein
LSAERPSGAMYRWFQGRGVAGQEQPGWGRLGGESNPHTKVSLIHLDRGQIGAIPRERHGTWSGHSCPLPLTLLLILISSTPP